MQRLTMAVTMAIALVVAGAPAPAAADGPTCSRVVKDALGYCPQTSVDGSGVTAAGERNEGGSAGSRGAGGTDATYTSKPTPRPPDSRDFRCANWTLTNSCLYVPFGTDPEDVEEIAALPSITITDLVRFTPAGTPMAGEPDNLGVAGLPTNFIAAATTQTQSGELFDFPIQVRFTPTTYTFHYGDGDSDTSAEGGASWESLGQAQFTPTETSHTYAERGTYDARVDVSYAAEINLGLGWFPVTGAVHATGPTQQIRIFEAHTALVANTCAERPTAPGC